MEREYEVRENEKIRSNEKINKQITKRLGIKKIMTYIEEQENKDSVELSFLSVFFYEIPFGKY